MSLKNIRIGDRFINIYDSPMPLGEKIIRVFLLSISILVALYYFQGRSWIVDLITLVIIACAVQLVFSWLLYWGRMLRKFFK